MKLASIVPMKNVNRTFDGDYAMLLTHLSDYYPNKHPRNCYVIMDNSLIELGKAASIEATYDAAIKCNANEIILPDVFRDKWLTLERVRESIDWLLYDVHDFHPFNLMAVCQGNTAADFIDCFHTLCAMPEIHCIGIPKVAETLLPEGRPGFEPLWRNCSKRIHLLGCWTSLNEMKQYKHPELIRSCDTCIPALLSTREVYDVWAKRPEKTIDLVNDEINPYVYEELLAQLREERLV